MDWSCVDKVPLLIIVPDSSRVTGGTTLNTASCHWPKERVVPGLGNGLTIRARYSALAALTLAKRNNFLLFKVQTQATREI